MAPVRGIEQLHQTVVAGRDVRRDDHVAIASAGTFADIEALRAAGLQRFHAHVFHASKRRRSVADLLHKSVERRLGPFHLHSHRADLVLHEAAEPVPLRQAVHERTKPDALHRARDDQRAAMSFLLRQGDRVLVVPRLTNIILHLGVGPPRNHPDVPA